MHHPKFGLKKNPNQPIKIWEIVSRENLPIEKMKMKIHPESRVKSCRNEGNDENGYVEGYGGGTEFAMVV